MDDDDERDKKKGMVRLKSGGVKWTEFECPSCDAFNPWGEGFRDGDEILCLHCAQPWIVVADEEEEKYKLVEE